MNIDLDNISEVIAAIGKYDAAIADSIRNFKNGVDNCEVEMAEDEQLQSELRQIADKLALDTYRAFKKNERMMAEEKAGRLYSKYSGVYTENRESGIDELDAYSDAEAEAEDLRDEEDEITEHITAMMFGKYND